MNSPAPDEEGVVQAARPDRLRTLESPVLAGLLMVACQCQRRHDYDRCER
jgi:hypothetical protein